MKILIYGAGVIGQIYAARLHDAGHEVTVLARHQTLQTLPQDGIILVNQAQPDPLAQRGPVRVEVTGEVGPDRSFELALVTVRRDQVDEILPALAGLPARLVVMMQNNSLDLARVRDIVGRDRTLFGFPGVGGYRRDDGAVYYIEIPQQPTTLGRQQGREDVAGAVFKSAGFAVSTTGLKMIFTIVPRAIAVRYWQGQLRGTLGTVALAPHSRMTKDTELPVLYRDVQKMVTGMAPTPHLDKLLALAQLLCLGTWVRAAPSEAHARMEELRASWVAQGAWCDDHDRSAHVRPADRHRLGAARREGRHPQVLPLAQHVSAG